jgi:tocopherol cyclase
VCALAAAAGLAAACRDTFSGELTLAVWEVSRSSGARTLLVRARSSQAALETGGGPWFAPWAASAAMAQPLRGAAALPLDVGALAARLPRALRPPGL